MGLSEAIHGPDYFCLSGILCCHDSFIPNQLVKFLFQKLTLPSKILKAINHILAKVLNYDQNDASVTVFKLRLLFVY